jgi:hypothetical protein
MRRRLMVVLALGFLVILGLCAGIAYVAWATFIGPPPGVGPKAEQGYRACAPIIDALARYHVDHGSYPKTLDMLVPTYISEVAHTAQEIGIDYRLTESSYQLEFRYAGPGMNICVYAPEHGWHCSGYY